jgi:peroxiredoxin
MRILKPKKKQSVEIEPGQQAHDFTLPSTQAGEIKLSNLIGRPVILAFYPKDGTSVCSSQLALYNEVLDMFQEYDATLLGISVDDLDTHLKYSNSLNLDFPLLSDADPKGEVAMMYGVYDEKHKMSKRALFVIDKDGIIRWSYISPPNINPGADGILRALEKLS